MATSLLELLSTLRSVLRSRRDLQLEILALRHQIGGPATLSEKAPQTYINRSSPLSLAVSHLATSALGVDPRQTGPSLRAIARASACFGLGRLLYYEWLLSTGVDLRFALLRRI